MKYRQNGYSIFGSYETWETEIPASGSGVIIGQTDDELLIVTNNHVVTDSTALSVQFCDDTSVDAIVKGTDSEADIAVLSVKMTDIPTATRNAIKVAVIGNSDETELGEQVVVIGNALGYGQSVTAGVLSAKNRTIHTVDGDEVDLLQTDAAINPGNSGGALLNMKGELIGINVAKTARTDVEGVGYSIPSSRFASIINDLSRLATKEDVPEAERGYLGVQVKNIDKQTAATFDMPLGVFIYKFTEGSSAQNSGMQEKDIITALNGQKVLSYDELAKQLAKYRSGETVQVTVQRPNGNKYDTVEVEVTLGSKEGAQAQQGQDTQESTDGQSGSDGAENDDSGEAPEGGNGLGGQFNFGDYGDLFRQFEEFFNQYQR